jgi:hypothetical protein
MLEDRSATARRRQRRPRQIGRRQVIMYGNRPLHMAARRAFGHDRAGLRTHAASRPQESEQPPGRKACALAECRKFRPYDIRGNATHPGRGVKPAIGASLDA